ncbi:hypothetical protein TNCV_2332491 [Trichonephila clavipes]|nr:hypothetical protein TNCV_2332491 [Trichonephila clavipes]
MRVWKQLTDEHRTTRNIGSGRRKVTSARDDRHLLHMAVNNGTSSSRQLAARRWSTATGYTNVGFVDVCCTMDCMQGPQRSRLVESFGRHLGRSDMVVALWQQWITIVYRRGGSGRPRNTNDREDRAIGHFGTNNVSIQRHLPPSRHPVPSRETIETTLVLRSRRPLRRLPLTPHHRQLDFADLGQLGV